MHAHIVHMVNNRCCFKKRTKDNNTTNPCRFNNLRWCKIRKSCVTRQMKFTFIWSVMQLAWRYNLVQNANILFCAASKTSWTWSLMQKAICIVNEVKMFSLQNESLQLCLGLELLKPLPWNLLYGKNKFTDQPFHLFNSQPFSGSTHGCLWNVYLQVIHN